ncbi:hypothetical protein SNEBB_000271 [Seison nebaliae]|nr:hypothetical protein SNEBB_000271 [Seison nebaliae]
MPEYPKKIKELIKKYERPFYPQIQMGPRILSNRIYLSIPDINDDSGFEVVIRGLKVTRKRNSIISRLDKDSKLVPYDPILKNKIEESSQDLAISILQAQKIKCICADDTNQLMDTNMTMGKNCRICSEQQELLMTTILQDKKVDYSSSMCYRMDSKETSETEFNGSSIPIYISKFNEIDHLVFDEKIPIGETIWKDISDIVDTFTGLIYIKILHYPRT